MKLQTNDWVQVRTKEEILGSLDKRGQLEGLPFMPQMFKYCGQRFRIFKRAHKTCDTVNPIAGRRVSNAVHLDLRCDGKAYGGCQAACLIFWKEAWLKPINQKASSADSLSCGSSGQNGELANDISCTEEDVWTGTRTQGQQSADEPRYFCQATQLPYFTAPLAWWDIRQYVEDYTSGNVTLGRIFRGIIYLGYYHFTPVRRGRRGRPFRWLYDLIQALWGGIPFPRGRVGMIPAGQLTPICTLNLQPGELVRVKPLKEILATLDKGNNNRGLNFDGEMVPFCGGIYRVRASVNNFINEKTGKMQTLKTPAVILDDVWCQSRYSNCRMFCPRAIYSWWREIWLERVRESTELGVLKGPSDLRQSDA